MKLGWYSQHIVPEGELQRSAECPFKVFLSVLINTCEKETTQVHPRGVEGIIPGAHIGPGNFVLPPPNVKNLIIHRVLSV